jgi:hypothetical protein
MASLFGGPGSLLGGPDTSQLTSATNADRARSDEFYRQLALLQQQYQQQLAQQGALGRSLDKTIAGTAPSVAGTQLQQGVGEIANATRATAAGASGENAALANYGSIQALAQAQAKANQDAANLRAREVAQAQQTKAGILNQQQQATGGMHGADVSGALGESGQATSGAGTLAGVNENEINSERALASNAVQGAGAALLKSDEDEKEDIKPVSGGDMDQFLKHIAGGDIAFKDRLQRGKGIVRYTVE